MQIYTKEADSLLCQPSNFLTDRLMGQSFKGMGIKIFKFSVDNFGERDMNQP